MKVRNGFVSNSSSSSFVVVFEKKPKNVGDVTNVMFPKTADSFTQPYDWYEAKPNREIAERVFQDVKGKRFKKSDIIYEFESRYDWCGENDNPIFEELVKENANYQSATEESRRLYKQMMVDAGIVEVPYAWIGGKKYTSGEPFNKKDVRTYESYIKKANRFRRENKAYARLQAERWTIERKIFNRISSLRRRLATIEADEFLKKHEGKYIVVLTYGDENGDGIMEHGDIFRNVEHIQFSHH